MPAACWTCVFAVGHRDYGGTTPVSHGGAAAGETRGVFQRGYRIRTRERARAKALVDVQVIARSGSAKRRLPSFGRMAAPTRQAGRSRHLVVVGNGPVGQRLVEAMRQRDADGEWRITVLGEEPRRAYDRVALSTYFDGATETDLD